MTETQQGPDWGDGAYESFSNELAPAAARLLEIAAPTVGERAIDLGCGDGNVTVPLVARGATVTAVDPSLRLLGLAAERVAAAGGHVATICAGAERLPLPDGDADLIVSNFGVIFAPDHEGAVREMLRVLAPGGRIVYSAWYPTGGISEAAMLMRRTVAAANPELAAGATAPLAWNEPLGWLAELVPGGADAIAVHDEALDFTAESGAAWLGHQEEYHPMWRAARRLLSEAAWRDLLAESSEILDRDSIEPGRMVVRSPYAVVEIRPQAG